jgi:hypothetical protein
MSKHYQESIGLANDWLTPPFIFEALGEQFDLDPASPGVDKCFVPTAHCFTRNEDGLAQSWGGSFVWMNPPYSPPRNGVIPWLVRFFANGNGIALVASLTSCGWFHQHVAPHSQTLVFPKGKTRFHRPDFSIGPQPNNGVVLVGVGSRANAALERCGLGWFVRNGGRS